MNRKNRQMKKLLSKISFLLLIIIVLTGCRTQSFSYTKTNILKNFSNYEVFLNSEKIAIDTIYLDKRNIKSVRKNEIEKTIHITQRNKNVEYFSPKEFAKSFLPPKEGACSGANRSVVINGEIIMLNNELAENITLRKIEKSAIKEIFFVPKYPNIFGGCENGTIVITLK